MSESEKTGQSDVQNLVFHSDLLGGEELLRPQRSIEYYDEVVNEYGNTPDRTLLNFTETNPKAYDASVLGWVLFPPGPLDVQSGEQPIIELKNQQTTGKGEMITEIPDDESTVFKIHTGWSVSVPDETQLMVLPMPNHSESAIKVIPTSIDSGTRQPLVVPVTVRENGGHKQDLPLCQVVLNKQVKTTAPTRTLSAEELENIQKNERKLNMYPSWYQDKKTSKHVGDW